jgi:hypothetical protein
MLTITIEYEASWRNSFLEGNNNEPLPKKGRNFIGSMTELAKEKNFIERKVTKDTVMGLLNRLIGEQRKLYQTRACLEGIPNYFADIEDAISYEDKPDPEKACSEVAYIRNMKGSTDQNSYTGMIKVNDPIFQSTYSKEFWGVLALDLDGLIQFVLKEERVDAEISLEPVSIMSRLSEIKATKPIENKDEISETIDILAKQFPKFKPLNNKGLALILPLYCSSLYLQLKRLEERFDMSTAKSKMGGISGISNNGFTPKDFMDRYTTGAKKLIYGNPYQREEFVKGEGKVKQVLKKASGELEIKINVDREKKQEIQNMITNAGVSSFYLGKKGLAYVANIR